MCTPVHALEIAVFAVVNAVPDAGGVIKVFISEALADPGTRINRRISFRENQAAGTALQDRLLIGAAENILVILTFYYCRIMEMGEYPLCPRIFLYPGLDVNMGKLPSKGRGL